MNFIINRNRYKHLYKINELNTSEKEEVSSIMDMDIDDLNSIKLDIFEEIKLKVNQVAYGYANSLLITGSGGLGKSYDTEVALEKSNKDYESISGGISTSGLFELLFTRNGEIILFDDCDSVFGSDESINILKAALDSKAVRKISRNIKTHFDTKDMTMDDIMANYLGDINLSHNKTLFNINNKGKLPKSFIYTGRIIFISNLQGKDIDPTIITRVSAHVDVKLSHEEVIERMKMIIRVVKPNIPLEKKEEVLRLINYLSLKYVTRYPITIRGLINAIDTRIANDFPTNVNGKSIPMWQILIKKDLLGRTAIKREDI